MPLSAKRRAPQDRIAIISLHSLEDLIVKHFMQGQARPQLPRRLPLRASEMPEPMLRLVGRAQRASPEETRRNPRARSATLRVAERTAVPFTFKNTRIEPGARWRN